MAPALQHRKVLVLSAGPYIRNLLALMQELDSQEGMDGEPLLDTINRQEFDAVVLELLWPDLEPQDEARGLGEIRAVWEGNLLVITAEISGPEALDMLEQFLVTGLPDALPCLIDHPCHSTL